ncbi:MAG: TonB-dependent receptor plug protein [Bacteroidota bacterium]|jgi:outer membrane receptor for ferrienterochelin and colicin|nr:TonB-dependent receptor plug protein [Bacteroidota bacterium]
MRKCLWFALLGSLFAVPYFGQVKGRVVEISQNKKETTPLPGVTVFWDHTSVGSSTDENGLFSIPSSPETNRLVVTAVGYKSDTLVIKDTTKFLTIKLRGGVELNEVEVVYESTGTELSYMSTIKMETLNEHSLMKAACCNLSESFETNPSVDVNFADAVTGTKQIQMLGLSGQYAQITKENMPYMRGLANGYGLSFVPGTWIQSIQLSKGAGSVINGYESLTGQINTELQNPETSDRLNFNAYVNQNARNEYNLNAKHRFNEKFAAGILSHMSFNPMQEDLNKDGFMDIPTGKQYNIMNKYSYNSGKSFEAQFGGGYLEDVRNGGQFLNLNGHSGGGIHTDTSMLYKIGINNKKWELYSKTGFVFRKKPGTSMGLQLSYLNHDQKNVYGLNTYTGLQKTFYANYIFQGIIKTTDNTYKLGASFMNDQVDETYRFFKFKRDERVGGAFAEFAHNQGEKFNVVAGLRADYHNYYGLFFTPRLHMRYALKGNKTVFRISGGRALKTANILAENTPLMATSRDWIITPSDLNMPYGLKPETGWNYGFNFTQKMKLNYKDAYVTIDLYRTDFTQQVVVDVDNNTQQVLFYNLDGPSYSNTAQFEFGWEIRKRLNIKTAYRFVDTKVNYRSGLLQKALVSEHRAFVNLSYETKGKHWLFDATLQYNGKKRLPQTLSNPEVYQRAAYSPDFYNVLAQITYLTKLNRADFHIYVGVENALDYKQTNPIVASDAPFNKYFDASMVWGPIYGRMLYAGLRFKIK